MPSTSADPATAAADAPHNEDARVYTQHLWGRYSFTVWKLPQKFGSFPGVYIYTRLVGKRHFPVLIEQAEDVTSRRLEHDKIAPGISKHSDYIHCRVVEDEDERREIEKELVAKYNPPLNVEHRTWVAEPEVTNRFPDRWRAAQSKPRP